MMDRTPDIRLIVTDLDGTLLDPAGEISPLCLEAIRECEKRGIRVVMSSGRTFENVRRLARGAGLNSPVISCNGGRVDASPFGPVILEDTLPLPLAIRVFDLLVSSGLFIECYAGNTIYRLHPEASPFLRSPADYQPTPVIRDADGFEQRFVDDDLPRMRAEGVPRAYKLAAFSRDPLQLDALRQQMAGMDVCITSSFPFNIEIMQAGRGKGRCVRFLTEWLNLRKDQVMAFGDNTNDREMLLASGVPVAMGNAVPELKEIASILAPSNAEDGEGAVINQYVLHRSV